jgi:hypothetical protein
VLEMDMHFAFIWKAVERTDPTERTDMR